MSEELAVRAAPMRWEGYLGFGLYVLCCGLGAWLWLPPIHGKIALVWLAALVSYGPWLLGAWLLRRAGERRRWYELARERGRRLRGIEQERRGEVERAFWLEAQRDALVALRARHATQPRAVSWREAWALRTTAQHLTRRRLALLLGGAWAFGIGLCWLDGAALGLSAVVPGLLVAWLGAEVWMTARSSQAEVRGWADEQRHLAELERLAGEPVAEEEVRAALEVWRAAQPETLDSGAALAAFLLLFTGLFIHYVIFYPVIYLVRSVSRRRAAKRAWREPHTRLAAALAERGLATLDATDRRRVEAEQRFWSAEQARAASALRGQFTREPAALSLRAALAERVRANRALIRVLRLTGLAAFIVSVLGVWLLGWASRAVVMVWLALASFLGGAVLIGLLIEAVMVRDKRAEQRRVFTQERRRIAAMAELAGGLTLAESMGDDALIGALSSEVAQGGALSGVEP